MSNLNFRKRRNRRGFFFHLSRHLPTFIVLFVIALVLGGGIFAFSRFVLKKQPGDRPVFATASEATKSNGTPSASAEADSDDPIGQLIDQADRLAKGYDYDKAMELLSQDPSIQSDPRISEALASFQSQKDSLVAADVKNVTHVFFHSLIMDTSKAFDGDSRMEGYNSVMTTKDEFLKILDALYNDGYVLVRIHDIAYETTDENGKEKWKAIHRGKLINHPDIEIITKFNAEIRGLYNYYRLANNVSVLSKFAYIMEYSMYKTYACKYRSTVSRMIDKYSRNGVFAVPYETKAGTKYCEFYHDGFKRIKETLSTPDILPEYSRKYESPNSNAARIKRGVCELCGQKTDDIRMHHVRTLKELTDDSEWERLMRKMRRKTLAVCKACHDEIHNVTA